MQKKMETTILYWGIYWGCIGIMENRMETTILCSPFRVLYQLLGASGGLCEWVNNGINGVTIWVIMGYFHTY